ncbi:T-complex protein 1 subunit beta, partial [Termitomyces sp. T159_Od127]
MENAKILIANTCKISFSSDASSQTHMHPEAMDTDKIKVFGARVKVDGTGKLAELERAER